MQHTAYGILAGHFVQELLRELYDYPHFHKDQSIGVLHRQTESEFNFEMSLTLQRCQHYWQ